VWKGPGGKSGEWIVERNRIGPVIDFLLLAPKRKETGTLREMKKKESQKGLSSRALSYSKEPKQTLLKSTGES